MAKKKPESALMENVAAQAPTEGTISLATQLSSRPNMQSFSVWCVGDTPLITHAWSEKARREMLAKQVKATKTGKDARSPEEDFQNSLYEYGSEPDGSPIYGFPATGLKNCLLSAAHKDRGVAKTDVLASLWINAQMVRTRPAMAGAICDMPLLRIYGSKPEMREDMVRVGAGLNKKASLAYRAQFSVWAFRVTGRVNTVILPTDSLGFLFDNSGISCGIGEWRNEKRGQFGMFHRANVEEEAAWTAYANGTGPLPIPAGYSLAA